MELDAPCTFISLSDPTNHGDGRGSPQEGRYVCGATEFVLMFSSGGVRAEVAKSSAEGGEDVRGRVRHAKRAEWTAERHQNCRSANADYRLTTTRP
jgi:hypothetical protein